MPLHLNAGSLHLPETASQFGAIYDRGSLCVMGGFARMAAIGTYVQASFDIFTPALTDEGDPCDDPRDIDLAAIHGLATIQDADLPDGPHPIDFSSHLLLVGTGYRRMAMASIIPPNPLLFPLDLPPEARRTFVRITEDGMRLRTLSIGAIAAIESLAAAPKHQQSRAYSAEIASSLRNRGDVPEDEFISDRAVEQIRKIEQEYLNVIVDNSSSANDWL